MKESNVDGVVFFEIGWKLKLISISIDNFDNRKRTKPTVIKLLQFMEITVFAECSAMDKHRITNSKRSRKTRTRMTRHGFSSFCEGIKCLFTNRLVRIEQRLDSIVASFNGTMKKIKGEVGMVVVNEEEGSETSG